VPLRVFHDALVRKGFNEPMKQLLHGLDKDNSKHVEEEDLKFLDRWKPMPFLLVEPNAEAAAKVRAALLDRYRNFLMAWRHLLDSYDTNRCNWWSFQDACKTLRFRGDVAGAWRHLDSDMSGYITLGELDTQTWERLYEFRKWCFEEFGGVRSAFGVWDSDGSGELSPKEFKRSCRIYGFPGSTKDLFRAFDISGGESGLSLKEIGFLDDWDMDLPEEPCRPGSPGAGVAAKSQVDKAAPTPRQDMCPGPGGAMEGPLSPAKASVRNGRNGPLPLKPWLPKVAGEPGDVPFPSLRLLEKQRRCRRTVWASKVLPPLSARLPNEEQADDEGKGASGPHTQRDHRETAIAADLPRIDVAAPVEVFVPTGEQLGVREHLEAEQATEHSAENLAELLLEPPLVQPPLLQSTSSRAKPTLDELLASPRIGPLALSRDAARRHKKLRRMLPVDIAKAACTTRPVAMWK